MAPGDEIRALYLIGSASQLQAKNGPFWRIELKDASGELEARIWSPLSQQFAEIPSGVIAEVEGRAESFRDKLQVNVNALRVLSPEETASVDTSAFMASSSRPPQEMLDELEALCRKEFTYKPWRKFILSVLEDEAIRVPLLTAPAAKSVHHAWVGGLLEHTLSVATLCLRFCDHYPDLGSPDAARRSHLPRSRQNMGISPAALPTTTPTPGGWSGTSICASESLTAISPNPGSTRS